jgi:hypothetical protein
MRAKDGIRRSHEHRNAPVARRPRHCPRESTNLRPVCRVKARFGCLGSGWGSGNGDMRDSVAARIIESGASRIRDRQALPTIERNKGITMSG